MEDMYDIPETASHIISRGYTRIALQFPDELLKDAVAVTNALRSELDRQMNKSGQKVSQRLFVLADTTFGSCCVDEVAAAHVNADCVVHYGHTCLSRTSRLPAWYVFGKAPIDIEDCANKLIEQVVQHKLSLLVLYGFEYAHAMHRLYQIISEQNPSCFDNRKLEFANVPEKEMKPLHMTSRGTSNPCKAKCQCEVLSGDHDIHEDFGSEKACQRQLKEDECLIGCNESLSGSIFGPLGCNPHEDGWSKDRVVLWIGHEDTALTNVLLTSKNKSVMRYDPQRKVMLLDVANQSRMLKRRYYLVERAKDANIVGILVGTLGVDGYQEVVRHLRNLVKASGKKTYTLVMGKPNPAKLANFPECDIFVLVACPQTALLDSKDFLAPLITPFEAILAFTRGAEWTGDYVLDFRSLMNTSSNGVETSLTDYKSGSQAEDHTEARFSFLKGAYVEDSAQTEMAESVESSSSKVLALSRTVEKALKLNTSTDITTRMPMAVEAKSGMEFLASRSYQGLETDTLLDVPVSHCIKGRIGRASVYQDEVGEKR